MFIELPNGIIVNLAKVFYIRCDTSKHIIKFVKEQEKLLAYECDSEEQMTKILTNIKNVMRI